MITIYTRPSSGGTIVATYCERRGLIEFRQGGRHLDKIMIDKHASNSTAKKIAMDALA